MNEDIIITEDPDQEITLTVKEIEDIFAKWYSEFSENIAGEEGRESFLIYLKEVREEQ